MSRLESPPLILHLTVKVLPVFDQQHSRSPLEEGGIFRLLRADNRLLFYTGRGGGAGVNLFALHKGSLKITNCLVNHERYLVINGNNNRLYQLSTV